MTIQFGSAQTCVFSRWTSFKSTCISKKLRMQYDDEELYYDIFAFDGPSLAYRTQVFKNSKEDLDTEYSRDQSKADLSDFEVNFKNTCNLSLDIKTSDGVSLTSLDTTKEDKKMIVTISPATEGWKTWITGASDDLNPTGSNSGRGQGSPLILNFSGPDSKSLDMVFSEPVEVHDAQIAWKPVDNWTAEDNFSVGVEIPETIAILTSSGGNCIPFQTDAGYNVFVPFPDGTHYVNFSDAVPVPASEKNGYWDVDYDTGSVIPSSTPGQANFHLLDIPISIWILKRIPMGNPLGTFDIDAYKTEYLHQKWKLKWKIEKVSPNSGSISAWVFVFRKFNS